MMLVFSSFVASIDGFLIGISLKFMKQNLTIRNLSILFLCNLVLYSLLLSLYSFFQFSFVTKFMATIFYLIFAFLAFREKPEEEISFTHDLSFVSCIFLTLTHSIDGAFVSLSFVYEYPLWMIIILFSFMAVLLMFLGYFFASQVKHIKKSNYVSGLLFFLLAIFNQFL